jgi:hypothetical protein
MLPARSREQPAPRAGCSSPRRGQPDQTTSLFPRRGRSAPSPSQLPAGSYHDASAADLVHLPRAPTPRTKGNICNSLAFPLWTTPGRRRHHPWQPELTGNAKLVVCRPPPVCRSSNVTRFSLPHTHLWRASNPFKTRHCEFPSQCQPKQQTGQRAPSPSSVFLYRCGAPARSMIGQTSTI